MSTVIQNIEQAQLRKGLPQFGPGDRVRVHFQVIEGNRRRPQVFEGVVLRRQGSGLRETFTVRKQSFGVGVERTFPLHSPKIEQLEIAARGDVRRAKLYYLRDRVGKAARVAERRWGEDRGPTSIVAVEEEVLEAVAEEAAAEQPEAADEAAPEAEAPAEAASEETPEAPEAEAEAPAEPEADAEAPEAEAEAAAEAPEAESADESGSEDDGASDEADESKA